MNNQRLDNHDIKILHVIGNLGFGGVETRLFELIKSQHRNGVLFSIVMHSNEDTYYSVELKRIGVEIYSVPRFLGYNIFRYIIRWANVLRKIKNLDVIHGHITTSALIYLFLARLFNIKIRIAHIRNSQEDNQLKVQMTRLSAAFATHLLAVSENSAKFAFNNYINKVIIINNSFNIPKFRFTNRTRIKIRAEMGIENNYVFGNVARFSRQKNHFFLIELFKLVTEVIPNAILLLIGDGPLKKNVEHHVNSRNLKDKVIILNSTEYVSDYYNVMDILLFPSLYEGFPGVVMEAQINGLPTLVSDSITSEIKIANDLYLLPLELIIWFDKINEIKNISRDRDNAYMKFQGTKFDTDVQNIEMINFYKELK